jgi:hypothetical protein
MKSSLWMTLATSFVGEEADRAQAFHYPACPFSATALTFATLSWWRLTAGY